MKYAYVVLADEGHHIRVQGAYVSRRKAFRVAKELEDTGTGGRTFKTELIDKKFERPVDQPALRVPKKNGRQTKKKRKK